MNEYAHSAIFYEEMNEHVVELIMTDEFKNHYKNTQKELLSRINVNSLSWYLIRKSNVLIKDLLNKHRVKISDLRFRIKIK